MKKNNLNGLFILGDLSNKEKLAIATTGLVLLVVVMSIISNFNFNDNVFGYDEFNVEEVINLSSETFDRQTYLDITNIVRSFVASYNLEINAYKSYINYDIINYKLEDYYYALSNEFQKSMNKDVYMEVAKSMCEKFSVIDRYGKYVPDDYKIIKNIYILPEDMYGKAMYICSLNTKTYNTTSYIGINLNKDTNKYSIFYLE